MAKKFFNYSFQIERTKKTGTIFVIVMVVLLVSFFLFYKSKSNVTSLDRLSYKVVLGMNRFEDRNCDHAYRLNYQKKTCGTICINSLKKDSNYLSDLQEEMQKNGFSFKKESSKKINNGNYSYVETANKIPYISYYVIDYENKTYSIEYIDQSSYLAKTNEKKCGESFHNFINSLKLK